MPSDNIDRLTLLIVTWNGDELLKRCLDSIIAVCGDLPVAVVVDNANSKTTRDLVSHYANAKYIPALENLGFAGGNNLGFTLCESEYVLLLNNDTELPKGANPIGTLIEFADTHPQLGAAQGTIVSARDPNLLDYCGLQLTPIAQTAALGLGELATNPKYRHAYPVFAASGAFLLVRRAAIAAIGNRLFFDEFKSYYEDVDLGQRLWMCGYEVWYVPTPPVLHLGSQTSKRFISSAIAEQGRLNHCLSVFIGWGILGLTWQVPILVVMQWGHAFLSLLRGSLQPFALQLRVSKRLLGELPFIWRERKILQAHRRRSDWELMRSLVVSQPLSYYKRLLKVT